MDDVQVLGGYGSVVDLGYGAVALDFDGLTARTLAHMRALPTTAQVTGTDGITRTDTDLTFVGGRVLLVFDTVSGTVGLPTDIELFSVREDWHAPTVTWDVAVDTAGDRRAWTQPGGGPSTSIGNGTFDVFIGRQEDDLADPVDTVSIVIDSAAVATLGDLTNGTTGLLLSAADPGVFINLLSMQLRLKTVPSTRPDTILDLVVLMQDLSFMIDPVPSAPVGWLRVGGTPSWRSVITMRIPRAVEGTADLCGAASCQIDLKDVDLNLAELVLTTRQTEPAFQPEGITDIDLRPVLNTGLLPKSPLGGRLLPGVSSLQPNLFSVLAGTPVILALTELVRAILSGPEPVTGPDASIALLSVVEPNMVGFASFEGARGVGAPALRLVFTIANDVGLP